MRTRMARRRRRRRGTGAGPGAGAAGAARGAAGIGRAGGQKGGATKASAQAQALECRPPSSWPCTRAVANFRACHRLGGGEHGNGRFSQSCGTYHMNGGIALKSRSCRGG